MLPSFRFSVYGLSARWVFLWALAAASACDSSARDFGRVQDAGGPDANPAGGGDSGTQEGGRFDGGEAGRLAGDSGGYAGDASSADASVPGDKEAGAVGDDGSVTGPGPGTEAGVAEAAVPGDDGGVLGADGATPDLDGATTPDSAASCMPTTPATPRPIAPTNGAHTGSTIAAPNYPTLRPSFRWSNVDAGDGCTSYHLQVDDSCSAGSMMQSCAFASPVIDATALSTTTFRPATDLPVSTTTRPLGSRYFWRVRACRAGACSAFSPVRYVDVGRVPGDFDGDGFSDVAISNANDTALTSNKYGVFVLPGPVPASSASAKPVLGADADAGSDVVGRSLAVGDLNGDGFADLAVGAYGKMLVFSGGADGIVKTRYTTLLPPSENAVYGASAAIGDWNGDGFADMAVGAAYYDGSDRGYAFVYYGAAAGVSTTAGVTLASTLPTDRAQFGGFGFRIASAGDMDGDGRDELAVAAPFTKGGGYHAGAAYVFRGASTGIGAVPWAVLDIAGLDSDAGYVQFGASMAAGDINNDGLSDLAVAQQKSPTVAVYLGGANPPDSKPPTLLNLPGRNSTASPALSVGDLNGDGWADLVVGDPKQEAGAASEGNVFVFYGNGQNWAATTGRYIVLDSPTNTANQGFGASVWAMGDLNGDGLGDLLAGAPMPNGDGGAAYVFLGSKSGLPASPWSKIGPWTSCTGCGDNFGTRVTRRDIDIVAPRGIGSHWGVPTQMGCPRRRGRAG